MTGNGTNTVTITATQNAINATFAAMNGVTYAPGASGVDTLTMTTNDLGNTGAGGAQQDSDLVVITVINVNDAAHRAGDQFGQHRGGQCIRRDRDRRDRSRRRHADLFGEAGLRSRRTAR